MSRFNVSRFNVKSRFKVQNYATKMEFHIKKSRFRLNSQFKESKCADRGHSLNRDFTVLIIIAQNVLLLELSTTLALVGKLKLATFPLCPVKYWRHPQGPPISFPHSNWVTLMLHCLWTDWSAPRWNVAWWQSSLASTITAWNIQISSVNKTSFLWTFY